MCAETARVELNDSIEKKKQGRASEIFFSDFMAACVPCLTVFKCDGAARTTSLFTACSTLSVSSSGLNYYSDAVTSTPACHDSDPLSVAPSRVLDRTAAFCNAVRGCAGLPMLVGDPVRLPPTHSRLQRSNERGASVHGWHSTSSHKRVFYAFPAAATAATIKDRKG